MNSYLVFAWSTYYPEGGLNDLIGMADTVEEARELLNGYEPECGAGGAQIVSFVGLDITIEDWAIDFPEKVWTHAGTHTRQFYPIPSTA